MFGSKLEIRRFEDRIEKYEAVPVQNVEIQDVSLPEDIICPLCKHGAADFEPVK